MTSGSGVMVERSLEKRRHSRMRAKARRPGTHPENRCRTREVIDFGRYVILDTWSDLIVAGYAGHGFTMCPDDVKVYLAAEEW
jgi:hypothetical protein